MKRYVADYKLTDAKHDNSKMLNSFINNSNKKIYG